MNKAFITAVIFLVISASLTGCYDSREIEELAYVMTIGIDKGVTDKLRLTVQFSTMSGPTAAAGGGMGGGGGNGGSQDGGEQDGYTAITMDVPSFFTGIDMINTIVPRKLNFMHTKALVFSEEMAREGIGDYIAPIVRYREIRRTIHVIVCKGSAADFIKENKPFIGTTLSKTMEIMMEGPYDTGFFPHVTLYDIYNNMKSTYRQPVAILGTVNDFKSFKEEGPPWGSGFKTGGDYYAGELPRKGGNKLELFGCAVFNGDKMVGELSGHETRIMMIGRGEFTKGTFTIKDPKKPDLIVPIEVYQEIKPKIKIRFEKDKPVIHLRVFLEGEILAVQSRINYETVGLKPLLEKSLERHIKSELDRLIQKGKDMNIDLLEFGRTAVSHFDTIQEWERFNWLRQFEKAEIYTDVEFALRRTGGLIKSSPIMTREGKK
ncbi:Spore germination protein B3 [Koleobacter methoxysyntrophicus]|uniref:Spore germination protein B3 n=2 Tax=Koleobacter methoxysyntrophicus TaxID=2751313 RepID=A0A8A0RI27_9FIRM|nr:Spore germination protein B3 [Koleobacter methoxysyntrophicus]